ncbi:MAG TPA: sigma-70 family RNA polymerase sigma factor [Terriglobia bacterium]|nr:sigma-70 family RNA polymerase sigma factor [Terriglobia bacterium]
MELQATALWMSRVEPEAEEIAILVQRAITGDVSAFEQIVLRHERRVLTLAWRLLGSMEDAQDAAQEVFLRTFRFLHRFDSRRRFEPWLIRMTVNVCRDLGRKKQQYPTGEFDLERLRAGGDPHTELSSEEQRQVLYAALAGLPEKERSAVVLRDIEGFSTAEVAEILGSSEATVRSQISTGRIKIRKAIERLKRGRK